MKTKTTISIVTGLGVTKRQIYCFGNQY